MKAVYLLSQKLSIVRARWYSRFITWDHHTMSWILLLFITIFASCDTDTRVEYESIERKDAEKILDRSPPRIIAKKYYSWQKSRSHIPVITKEYFRCKGSSLNPPKPYQVHGKDMDPLTDCGGAEKHSLPLRGNQEYIYPILLELLNHVQTITKKPVIITSGHRCTTHNTYIDQSTKNSCSKHTIGAEVDFYVRGFESNPEHIISILQNFFTTNPRYCSQKEYLEFHRFEKNTDVTVQPWYNKEVFIKLYQQSEGRNLDNRHSYPYITIQVRFDRTHNARVNYTWADAQRIFHK